MKFKERMQLTRRGYGLIKKYCPGLLPAKVSATVADTLLPFVTIWFSARIINEITGDRDTRRLAIYVALTVLTGFVFSMIKNALNKVVEEKESGMWSYFPKIFSDKQLSMDYSDLEDQEIQKQKQKAEENLFMFGNGLAQLVWDTVGLVQAIVGIVASVSLTATLFLSRSGNAMLDSSLWIPAAILLIVIAGICTGKLRKKEEAVFEKWTDGTVWFNRALMFFGHTLYDDLSRAMDVRIYRQDRIADREMEKLNRHNRNDNGIIQKMSAYSTLPVLIQGVCNCLCYVYVVAKAAMGAFPVGSIVQYVGALIKLVQSFAELVNANSENIIYTEHLQKLFAYLDIPSKKTQGDHKPESENAHTIEFKYVSFRYPGSEQYVLKNVNVTITPEKKLALVGANGAGKTTFVKLLCRLYDPDEGEILLDGINIKEYDSKEYVKLFSYVFQDFKLFSLSLGENIAANAEYDAKKAQECIDKVSFAERFDEMQDGLETCLYKAVAEDGVMISGGEAQKIALARALYKDAPIVVLDEPTATLDPIAEAQVYSDFGKLVNEKTAIYVSHRLSSCRFCDEILVFDHGEIVQTDDHTTLVDNKDGKYYELWNAQAQYYL
ncbi:MAG: ABC transporter ATP-binding protein [Lachnospiraceae bacterium]|nr:ABC transporter ATP-binding protein [Lachnospiraceae bacterium]